MTTIRFLVSFVILGSMLAGCGGTTHHFLPPRALEKKEWMISITWHHDLNKLSRPKLLPDANAYVGIGNDYNFGFGYQMPIFASHLTFAHYDDAGRGDLWTEYFILNKPFGANTNPYFELGASYIDHHSGYYQTYSAGLAYGHGFPLPLTMLADNREGQRGLPGMRLMPVLKYTLAGHDFGVSLSHYSGITSSGLAMMRRNWFKGKDETVLDLTNDEIEDISPRTEYTSGTHFYTIKLVKGELVEVWDEMPFTDLPGNPHSGFEYWLNDDLRLYHFHTEHGWIYNVIVDMEDVRRRWQAGEDIRITGYPQSVADQMNRVNGLIGDNSVGAGLIFWDMPED